MKQILLLAMLTLPGFGQMFPFGSGPHIAHAGGGGGGTCTPAGGYAHCRVLTADHTQMGGATLTNFPVLVSTALGASRILNASCFDVVFTSDSGGTALIPWEQESCAQSTGVVVDWVLCASCSSSVDTLLYVSYGNAGVAVSQNTGASAPVNVWDANFKAVLHFGSSSTLSLNGSTSNANVLTNVGATAASGLIGGAWAGDGAQYSFVPDAPSLNPTTAMTLSAWLRVNAYGGPWINPVGKLHNGGADGYGFYFNGYTQTIFAAINSGPTPLSTTSLIPGTWFLITMTYDSANVRLFINGVQEAVTAYTAPINHDTTAFGYGFVLGSSNSLGNFLNGELDEVRLSNSARAPGWITAEVNNQKSGSTFLAVGAEI